MKKHLLFFYILRLFALNFCAALFILWLFDALLEFLGEISILKPSYTSFNAMLYSAVGALSHLSILIPFCAIVASSLSFYMLVRRQEFIAFRALGFTKKYFFSALLLLSLPVIALHLVFNNFISPVAANFSQIYRTEKARDIIVQKIEKNIWIKKGQNYYYIARIEDQHAYHLAHYTIKDGILQSIETAPYGDIGHFIILHQVQLVRFFPKLKHYQQKKAQWNITLSLPEGFFQKKPIYLTSKQLQYLLTYDKVTASEYLRRVYQAVIFNRWLSPFATFFLLSYIVPFLYRRYQDKRTIKNTLVLGGIVGVIVFMTQNILFPSLLNFGLTPLLAALMPLCVSMALFFCMFLV